MSSLETVFNIEDLRNYQITPSTSTVYVEYHSNPIVGGGGVFWWFAGFTAYDDNDGTVIKSYYREHPGDPDPGRWIRQFDGHIDIRFFGCTGYDDPSFNDSDKIQAAINHAYIASTSGLAASYPIKGNTIHFPGGFYNVKGTLILKSGVSMTGESYSKTYLRSIYDLEDPDSLSGYMIEMDGGPVEGCNISNITFFGNRPPYDDVSIYGAPGPLNLYTPAYFQHFSTSPDPKGVTKGCILFRATHGGLWRGTFKNIRIIYFNGNGVFMEDVDRDYQSPNQFTIFENTEITRQKEETFCLVMLGQHGQFTFINSVFNGIQYNYKNKGILEEETFDVTKGFNVHLTGNGEISMQPAVISFINCSFQVSEYGIHMVNCESITIDTCWFEILDLAVTVKSAEENKKSKGINILNSRFINSGGFGSLPVSNQNMINKGRCITSVESEINVYNNYVTVSYLENKKIDNVTYSPFGKLFIYGKNGNSGIRTTGNSFRDERLGYSFGILQEFFIESDPTDPSSYYIDLRDTKIAIVMPSKNSGGEIERIVCSISSGETISIKAHGETIKFNAKKNIYFSNQSSLKLSHGDIATFIKIDEQNNFPGFAEIFQLISVIKSTTVL